MMLAVDVVVVVAGCTGRVGRRSRRVRPSRSQPAALGIVSGQVQIIGIIGLALPPVDNLTRRMADFGFFIGLSGR
jgi:hypothetical protein